MVDNIIPYIGGEEEKSEQEPLRIFGKVEDGVIKKAEGPIITTQCIRVPVSNGHTAAVFVSFKNKPSKEQILKAWKEYKGLPQELNLPSAPEQFITYFEEENRPQANLDRDKVKDKYWEWTDGVYYNSFVGLSFETFDNWHQYTNEELIALQDADYANLHPNVKELYKDRLMEKNGKPRNRLMLIWPIRL